MIIAQDDDRCTVVGDLMTIVRRSDSQLVIDSAHDVVTPCRVHSQLCLPCHATKAMKRSFFI